MMIINAPANNNIVVSTDVSMVEVSARGVVFRATQKLGSNDGREIYFYTNGKCEMYFKDRREVTCRYNVSNGEVRLLDEKGNTVYKGSYRMRSNGRDLASVTIQGTTYWAK